MRPRSGITSSREVIDNLPQNSSNLQSAVNGVFREIFKWLGTDNNYPVDTFCIGSNVPTTVEVEYMKSILYGDCAEERAKQLSIDHCFAEYLLEKKQAVDSYATKKSIRNGLQHVLRLIKQPKISDADECHVYPDTSKVLKNWTLSIKQNPVQKVSAAPIESDTRVAIHELICEDDYTRMLKAYCVIALNTGSRGIKAMWGLKAANIIPSPSKFIRGSRGSKNPRYVDVIFEKNKNNTTFFEAPVACTCLTSMGKSWEGVTS